MIAATAGGACGFCQRPRLLHRHRAILADFEPEERRRIPALDRAALYGPIGDYITALAPHTEASPAGILGASITTMGAMLGSVATTPADDL